MYVCLVYRKVANFMRIFLLNRGTIMPAQDIETIPEILLLSIHAVFIAPVFEELTFRYSLSAYKSTRGKWLLCF